MSGELNQRKQPKPGSRKSASRKNPRRKNTKITGERSEAAFLNRAASLGFGVAKPWGDSRRYDFIVDNGRGLLRVQVKCTESIRARAYETRAMYTVGKGRAVYTRADVDFIAAHVVPLDIWYIIPVEICTPAPMLRFYPHRQAKKMRLEPYREAWHLLQSEEETGATGKIELQARADETTYDETIYPDGNMKNVGTAAPGCPPSAARQGLCSTDDTCGAGAPARELPATKTACNSERSGMIPESKSCPKSKACPELAAGNPLPPTTTPIRLPKSAAPWPIPPLRILATRKGKQILPNTSE